MAGSKSWALYLVLLAVVFDYVGVTMMRVALPFYVQALGGAGTLIGGLETAYGVGQWLGAITLPRLSDSWGRRRVLILCSFLSALGYSIALASLSLSSPLMLLISRVPVGVAKQTVTVSRAVVADCTEASTERSRWMAYQCTALAIGCSLGPLLASWAAGLLGEAAPVAVAAVVFAILAPSMALALPETSPRAATAAGGGEAAPETQQDAKEEKAGDTVSLWRNRRVQLVLLILALPELGLVAHQGVTLNTFSLQVLGMTKSWIASLNSLSAVIQATTAGTVCAALARRGWSDVTLLQLGSGSFALASLAIWRWQSETAVMYSAPAAAVANSVLRSFPAALLSKHVPAARQGEAMGVMDVTSSVLRVLAPVLAGAFMDTFGGASVFLCQAALFLCAIFGLESLRRSSSVAIAKDGDSHSRKKK
eukprot:TRINITY_DN49474_c0_g1_i1.p1 TRINITY_DN49474_c0_g1~~TRINITY_DN49474_c0_g1_i1.p1  ORF type:complete len:438 (+),score=75.51 TRINITY_DN49474_c0_g1_i1:46-1314(+)